MSARAAGFAACGAVLLITALTVGSFALLVTAVAVFAILALSLLTDTLTVLTVSVKADCRAETVARGENAEIIVTSSHFSPLIPGTLIYEFDSGETLKLSTLPFVKSKRAYTMNFPHRGVYMPGGGRLTVKDAFNLFSFSKRIKYRSAALTVLPQAAYEYEAKAETRDTGEMRMRLQEDAEEPSSVREWRDGDQIRRIHWKLTLKNIDVREGTLKPIIKTYDEAVRPDVLIIPDTSAIPAPEKRRKLIEDAVCECALSAAEAFAGTGSDVRIICGTEETDINGAAHMLAGTRFDSENAFERAASEVMKRAGRTANIVFVKARLSYRDADMLIRLKQAANVGTDLIWVTDSRMNEVNRLSARLESGGVRVSVVTPENRKTE